MTPSGCPCFGRVPATPDCTCNAPSGNTAWHHEWNCARLATPAPDTPKECPTCGGTQNYDAGEHGFCSNGWHFRGTGYVNPADTMTSAMLTTPVPDTQSSTDKPQTYPTDTQPDEPLEPQYKSETTVQAKSAEVEQYQPVFDTQPGDELFDEAFHEWLEAHGVTFVEVKDPPFTVTVDLNKLKLGFLRLRERERQAAHDAAYTQGRRDELEAIIELAREDKLQHKYLLLVLDERLAALQEKPKS